MTITEKRPDGISIRHDTGTARIMFEDLPDQLAQELGGFDPEQAAKARDQQRIDDANHAAAEEALFREQQKIKAANDEKVQAAKPEIPAPASDETTSTLPAPTDAAGARSSAVKIYARTVAMSRKDSSSTNFWVGGTPMEEEILYERTKQIFRHRVIAVDVTNKGETSDFILEVFWLGHPLNKASRTCVNALAAKKITVPPQTKVTIQAASNYNFVDSALIYLKRESRGSDYWNGLYVRTWSGYGYAGWVARVSDGHGKTLAIQGARPPMIAFASDFNPPTLGN